MNVPLEHDDALDADASHAPLAWAGWRIDVPRDWRPLKLKGTADKGSMMVGDDRCAMFSIHWEQAGDGSVRDGRQWIDKRLQRLGVLPDAAPPAADRFSACGWAYGVQSEEEKQTTYWYGYNEPARLLLGIKVNGVLPKPQRDTITHGVLPTLRTSAADAETTWAMYDLSFVTPGGFKLARRHLFAGDVALGLTGKAAEMLIVRQVYPGGLALSRRPFARWLDKPPFLQRRRLSKSSVTTEPWSHGASDGLTGICRRGRKRIAFPLGLVAPRWTDACAVHDQVLDRVLIAEHLSADKPDGSVARGAILRMNQDLRGGV